MQSMHTPITKTKIGFLPFKQYSTADASVVIHQKPAHAAAVIHHKLADDIVIHQKPVHASVVIHQKPVHASVVIHHKPANAADVVHQPIHAAAVVIHQPVHHDSAGIIIIEDKYYDKIQRVSYQTILLGHNSKTNQYELFYGKRDATDASSMETAQRECSEETSNMFRFSSGVISDTYSVCSPNKKHRAYVVRVQPPPHGIKSEVFRQNHAVLKLRRAPHSWTELSAINRICVKEAISSGILEHPTGRHFSMFDVYGNSITIFSRDAEFIRDALKSKMNLNSPIYPLRFIKSYDDKFDGNRNQFLNGTSCYMA
jgi:hypothetical protein